MFAKHKQFHIFVLLPIMNGQIVRHITKLNFTKTASGSFASGTKVEVFGGNI